MANPERPRKLPRCATTAFAALWVASGGCNQEPKAATDSPIAAAAPAEVAVVNVQYGRWPRTVRVQGSLMADERAVIGTKLAGRIDTVAVDLGSIVSRGQSLVVLERRELQLQADEAEAQLRQACAAIGAVPEDDETQLRRELAPPVVLEQALVDEAEAAVARGELLLPQNSISRIEYDRMVAQLKTARARLNSALQGVSENIALIAVRRAQLALVRQSLADAEIIAPFDAVVEQRRVSQGQYVAAGEELLSLVRVDRLRFTGGIPESKAAQIQAGQTITIRVPGIEKPFTASISRISPTITQASRSLWIEADLDNPDHRVQAGVFAEGEIVVDPAAQALVVPMDSVSKFAGVQKVWLVQDGQARQQTVLTGREDAARIEIVEGLSAGDQIIASASLAREGSVIPVAAPSAAAVHANTSDAQREAARLE